MTPHIVLLAGRAGSGKTTLAKALHGHGYSTRSLATPLKRVVGDVLSLIDVSLYNAPWTNKARDLHDDMPALCPPGSTVRKVLQRVGTEGFRSVVPEIWTVALMADVLYGPELGAPRNIVVDDVRFPDELDMLKRWAGPGVTTVLVETPGNPTVTPSHSSEIGFTRADGFDLVLRHDRVLGDDPAADMAPYVEYILEERDPSKLRSFRDLRIAYNDIIKGAR